MTHFTDNTSVPAQSGLNNRRSFLQKLGIGVSTAIGSAAVMAKGGGKPDNLSAQVAKLEAEKLLRALHQRYEQALDQGQMDTVLALFAPDAEVIFNGGVFSGREQGLARLYRRHFADCKTGKRMEAAPGFALASGQQQERVEVADDLHTATAQFPYSIQVGRPVESASSLVSMARVHCEGIHTWWEGGVYELVYEKDAAAGAAKHAWKIKRLAYNTQLRADYRAGKSCASPMVVAAFTACFPEHAQGPDRLA